MSTQNDMAGPRVLFLGENLYGSCARAQCYAFLRLGCDVADIDEHRFVPSLSMKSSRALVRLAAPRLLREYNDAIVDTARQFRPDFLIASKGAYVQARTLQ